MTNVVLIDDSIKNSLPISEYLYIRMLEFEHDEFWEKVPNIRNKIGSPSYHNGMVGWKRKAPDLRVLHKEVENIVNDPQYKIEPLFFSAIMDIIQNGKVLRALQPIQVYQKGKINISFEPTMPVIVIQKNIIQDRFIKYIKENWDIIKNAMDEHEKELGHTLHLKETSIKEIDNCIMIYRDKKKGYTFPEIYKNHFQDIGVFQDISSLGRKYRNFINELNRLNIPH